MSDLIELLNGAFESENKAFRGYMFAAVTVTGPLHDVYEKIYKSFANREAEHIYEIGEKIVALGGKPSTKCLPITEVEDALSSGYDAVLDALQQYEANTLDMYKNIHKVAMDEDKLEVALLLEHIIEEESEHYDELERILIDVPGKSNVEAHDVLEISAFTIRNQKLATMFDDIDDNNLLRLLNKIFQDKMLEDMKVEEVLTKDTLYRMLKEETPAPSEAHIKEIIGNYDFFIIGRTDNEPDMTPMTKEEAITLAVAHMNSAPHSPLASTDFAGPGKASFLRRKNKLAIIFDGE